MKLREIKYLIIHCSATPDDRELDIEEVRRWHVQDNGWSDVGYHYFIKRNGVIEKGRPEEVIGSHTATFNSISIGICLAGGLYSKSTLKKEKETNDINHYTDAQIYSLKKLINILLLRYPYAKVRGHKSFNSAKTCPNFDVKLLGYK